MYSLMMIFVVVVGGHGGGVRCGAAAVVSILNLLIHHHWIQLENNKNINNQINQNLRERERARKIEI